MEQHKLFIIIAGCRIQILLLAAYLKLRPNFLLFSIQKNLKSSKSVRFWMEQHKLFIIIAGCRIQILLLAAYGDR